MAPTMVNALYPDACERRRYFLQYAGKGAESKRPGSKSYQDPVAKAEASSSSLNPARKPHSSFPPPSSGQKRPFKKSFCGVGIRFDVMGDDDTEIRRCWGSWRWTPAEESRTSWAVPWRPEACALHPGTHAGG